MCHCVNDVREHLLLPFPRIYSGYGHGQNEGRTALLLMNDDPQLSMEQALAIVINSDTYQRLQRDATGLYHQSTRYVYSFLLSELKTGSIK